MPINERLAALGALLVLVAFQIVALGYKIDGVASTLISVVAGAIMGFYFARAPAPQPA